MAKSRFTSMPSRVPDWPFKSLPNANALTSSNSTALDSSGDRLALVGTVHWEDGATHSASIIHWRSGSATSPSFTLRVGLRDVNTAAGPPARDDGTVDQSGTHVNPAANTNFSTTLDATRSLAHGAEIAVVWDFSAYTSGSITIQGFGLDATNRQALLPSTAHFDGTSTWTLQAMMANVTIEADDGTIGHIYGSFPRWSAAAGTVVLTNASNPRRVALEFTVSENRWAGAFGFWVLPASATTDFKISLYEDTTEVASKSFDAHAISSTNGRWAEANFGDIALTTGHTYRVALESTTAGNVTVYYFDVSTAAHLDSFADAPFAYNTYDGSNWGTATTTRLPFAWYGLVAIEDGTGGSGGGPGNFMI